MSEQLLHIVIGGELEDVSSAKFRDLSQVEFVGAYPDYASAKDAWKARAQATVDNALMRFFILHAHRLIDPTLPDPKVQTVEIVGGDVLVYEWSADQRAYVRKDA